MTHYIPTLLYNFLITHVFTLSFYRSPHLLLIVLRLPLAYRNPPLGGWFHYTCETINKCLQSFKWVIPVRLYRTLRWQSQIADITDLHWLTVWCAPTSRSLFGFNREFGGSSLIHNKISKKQEKSLLWSIHTKTWFNWKRKSVKGYFFIKAGEEIHVL